MADASLSIVGPNSVTQQQILTWMNQHVHAGSSALTDSIFDIIGFYINEGQTQGIRGDVAFVQACQETGYFGAPGAAPLLRKNNFAGIAVPSAFSAGDGFPTAQLGVRAHIQLLAKVAGGNSVHLLEPNVAPNWGGRQATTWGGLNDNWAVPGTTYGQEIIAIFNSILGGNSVGASGTEGVVSSVNIASVATALIPPIDPTWQSTKVVTSAMLSNPFTGAGTQFLEAVTTDSTVDLTVNQLSEIDLTLVDPDFSLTAPIPSTIDPQAGVTQTVSFLGEIMNIDDVNTLDVQGTGTPGVILRLRPRVLSWANTQRKQRNFAPVSAADWIAGRIAEYNATLTPDQTPATFLGQETGTRTEAGPWLTLNAPTQGVTQWQSYYDVMQQMAQEDGAWLFECNGGVFYGQPSWVATIGPSFKVGWPGLVPSKTSYAKSAVDVEMTSVPIFERSLQVFTGDTVQFYLPHNFGEQVRPGMNFKVQGVPGYWAGKLWLVNEVQWNLDGQQTDVRISANESYNPTPSTIDVNGISQFTNPPLTDPTGQQITGTATNAAFFAMAMTQATAKTKYTWGGTNPQTGLDCSGLVMWALAQLGINWPHYSGAQYAQAKAAGGAISVAQAYNTLGALVFRNNATIAGEHEAICVGDGISVLQAPHTGTVVQVDIVAQDYFQEGALIPGIQYSSSQASASPMGAFVP